MYYYYLRAHKTIAVKVRWYLIECAYVRVCGFQHACIAMMMIALEAEGERVNVQIGSLEYWTRYELNFICSPKWIDCHIFLLAQCLLFCYISNAIEHK